MTEGSKPAAGRCISIVLPVYDEQDSIAECLRGLARALEGHEHEILVCHDSDEDRTLPAIAAMPDRPRSVVLVRNRIGPGAANALRAGFAAARGDVVVTTMADLSDPPEIILKMAEAIRSGADVVSGSRYMPGGSQSGGPWLKRTLSRIAGISLAWIAGVRTRDATSNFRGYSRSFLQRVTIESRRGFEIALELTVKAHLSGARVSEVPSSWVDRSAGKSRFRLWRWMPNYLRWYLRAMAAPLLVGTVWILMAIDALRSHSAHVGFLAAVSLGMILAARRMRGRTSATDAFLPLLFLIWGHGGRTDWAVELGIVLPAVLLYLIWCRYGSGRARRID